MSFPQSNLLSTLTELLNHSSVTGTEGPMQELIERQVLAQSHGSAARVRLVRHRQSLVVYVDPPVPFGTTLPHKEFVMILGHTDTVPGECPPARIDGDKIIGLGASDMKSGLAVMIELLSRQHIDQMTSPTAFVFYAGEEGPSQGNELLSVIDSCPPLRKASLALFPEPTDRTVQLGCLGLLNLTITFHGKAAHSARPWNGVNAIHRAGRFLTALDAMQPRKVQVGSVEYVEVCSATLAKGGTATNVVPGSFELNLNVRIAPGTNPLERVAELQALAGDDVTIAVTDRAPAGRVPINNVCYERFRRCAAVPEAPKQAYTDVGLLSELGIDAVNFGPGLTGQCHVAGEYALISDIEWCFGKYLEFLTT